MKEKRIIIILSVFLGLTLLVIAFLLGRDYSFNKQNNSHIENKYSKNVDEVVEKKVDDKKDDISESDNTNDDNVNNTSDNLKDKNTNSKSENISSNNTEVEKRNAESSTSKETVDTTKVEYTTNDKNVIEEVERIEKETDTLLESSDKDSALDKAKGVFISLVDFVFYGGKIKGVTFEELTDSGKEKVLKVVNSIDTKIEKKYPNYKDNISSKASGAFKKASEVIKNGAKSISEFSYEKLGEENYNNIIAAKDELVAYTKTVGSIIKDKGGNLLTKSKDAIKKWYENFRNN